MSIETKVLQIMPADGWRAVYVSEGDAIAVPLVCWALEERTNEDGESWRVIVGMEMVDGVCVCQAGEDCNDYVGYAAPGVSDEDLQRRFADDIKRLAARAEKTR